MGGKWWNLPTRSAVLKVGTSPWHHPGDLSGPLSQVSLKGSGGPKQNPHGQWPGFPPGGTGSAPTPALPAASGG